MVPGSMPRLLLPLARPMRVEKHRCKQCISKQYVHATHWGRKIMYWFNFVFWLSSIQFWIYSKMACKYECKKGRMEAFQLGEVYVVVCRFIHQPDIHSPFVGWGCFGLPMKNEMRTKSCNTIMNERINDRKWNQMDRGEKGNKNIPKK